METPDFKVGDVVFVVDRVGPTRRVTVTEIKQYKRGPKVTCSDDSEWDLVGRCRWGSRGDPFHTASLEPHTEELEAQFRRRRWKQRVAWASQNFDALTHDQQEALGELATRIRKDFHKEK